MEADHQHHHHHGLVQPQRMNRAFVTGIVLNSLFVIAEVIAGIFSGSLALLTDAGHNLSDVATLSLSLFAFRLAKSKPTDRFTYGYGKTTVLVTLLNAIILLIAIGSIGYEAFHRLLHPETIPGKMIAIIAAAGIVINSVTAYLFMRDKEKDLNIKGAYIHLAADALVSAGVVVAGIIIVFTGWFWMDSAISFIIMIVILISTWSLLRDSLRLSLDAVPPEVNLEKIRSAALKIRGVKDIHHLHVWALSTTETALTAHIRVESQGTMEENEKIKQLLKHELAQLNINHVTLEIEADDVDCETEVC